MLETETKQLIAQLLSRNERALHKFYSTYAPKLFRYVRVRINKEEDVQEIVQDTLFAFLESLRDYQGKSKLETYLYAICSHKIIDFYRRKKLSHVVFSKLPQLESLVAPLFSANPTFDDMVAREHISRIFSDLLPRYRDILCLKYIEGLSVEEIATTLNISFKTAEARLFRARKAFITLYATI